MAMQGNFKGWFWTLYETFLYRYNLHGDYNATLAELELLVWLVDKVYSSRRIARRTALSTSGKCSMMEFYGAIGGHTFLLCFLSPLQILTEMWAESRFQATLFSYPYFSRDDATIVHCDVRCYVLRRHIHVIFTTTMLLNQSMENLDMKHVLKAKQLNSSAHCSGCALHRNVRHLKYIYVHCLLCHVSVKDGPTEINAYCAPPYSAMSRPRRLSNGRRKCSQGLGLMWHRYHAFEPRLAGVQRSDKTNLQNIKTDILSKLLHRFQPNCAK